MNGSEISVIELVGRYELSFLLALLVSLAIEVPLLLLLVRFFVKPAHFEFVKTLLVGLLATAVSLPFLWFFLVPGLSFTLYPLLLGEAGVLLVEAGFYHLLLGVSWRQALFLSLITNAASFLVGLILF